MSNEMLILEIISRIGEVVDASFNGRVEEPRKWSLYVSDIYLANLRSTL